MIESKDNPEIKKIIKMMKFPSNKFIVQGKNLVNEAISSGKLQKLYHLSGESIPIGNFEKEVISTRVAEKISNVENGSNMFGVCEINNQQIDYSKPIVVLEKVQDPGNLGNIIRTLAAFDWPNLILINCVNPYNQKVIRSAMGGHFYINIVVYNETNAVIKILNENNYLNIGLSLNGKQIKQTEIKNKTAYWFGNEGRGLLLETQEKMHENILIPIKNVESLNVGTTVAVVVYTINQE